MTPTDTLELVKRAVLKAPKTRAEDRTILSISGYPHYENVASNILAFFLDPEESHDLGTTVLESLLRVVDENLDISEPENIEVRREDQTAEGSRIDIVVSTSEYVIGIENKIRHGLNNPLREYMEHLEVEAAGSRKIVPIVLTPKPKSAANDAKKEGFKVTAYDDFLASLSRALNDRADSADPAKRRYRWFLEEFMKEMKCQAAGSILGEEWLRFLADNQESVDRLWKSLSDLNKEMERKARQLREMLASEFPAAMSEFLDIRGVWHDKKRFALSVHFDIDTNNLRFRIDCWLRPRGWEISVWPGPGNASQRIKLERLIQETDLTVRP